MTDEPLFATFRQLDTAIEPDSAFAERLFEDLAVELGFRGPARARAQAGWRRRPWSLIAAALLLLGLVIGVLGVGSLLQRQGVVELQGRSVATYDELPAFAMTAELDEGVAVRILSDGNAVRWELVAGFLEDIPVGSWTLQDGTREVRLLGDEFFGPADSPFVRYASLDKLTWLRRNDAGEILLRAGEPPPLETCIEWTSAGTVQVAGRTAEGIACGDRTFWVDRESGLILRYDDGGRARAVVTSLDLAPALDPALFAFAPPPGYQLPPTPPGIEFAVGDPLPAATLSLLEGGELATDSLRGTPSAVYFWCPCSGGLELGHVISAAEVWADRINVVIVANASPGAAAAMAAGLAYDGPVAVDPAMELNDQWRLSRFPMLVLLDRDGGLAGINAGKFTADELATMLAPLASGKSVPAEVVQPPGTGAISATLVVGELAPAWTATLLDGTELRNEQLRGLPTVMYFVDGWSLGPGGGSGMSAQLLEALAIEAERRSGRVNLVLVSRGEPEPGYLAGLARDRGWVAPVAIDWIDEIFSAYGFAYYDDVVVLDAEGRVLTFSGGCCPDVGALLDALEAGAPLPSPTVYMDDAR